METLTLPGPSWPALLGSALLARMPANNKCSAGCLHWPGRHAVWFQDSFGSLDSACDQVNSLPAGEKLSDSRAGDVRELCNTLLNCYLIQLLETGFLHADPHPVSPASVLLATSGCMNTSCLSHIGVELCTQTPLSEPSWSFVLHNWVCEHCMPVLCVGNADGSVCKLGSCCIDNCCSVCKPLHCMAAGISCGCCGGCMPVARARFAPAA